MAINVGNGMNRGRRSRGPGALSEINVTPFVDVALVLLIIFMITANVMEYGINIDVPKTKTVSETTIKDNPAVVQINKTGDVYLGKEPVNIHRMADEIHRRYPGQDAVFIRVDAETRWDLVATVMSELGAAKFNVRVMTRPDDGGKRR